MTEPQRIALCIVGGPCLGIYAVFASVVMIASVPFVALAWRRGQRRMGR